MQENERYKLDPEFLLYAFFNDPGRNNSGWHNVAVLAEELLRMKGIDIQNTEYKIGNYQGSGKVAIMKNNSFVRWE